MKKVKLVRLVLLILIIAWAILVFCFSGQNGSESSGLSRKIVEIFIKDPEAIEVVEPYVRKAAHFSEYGLGGILFASLFSTYKWKDRKIMIVSIALGAWYATCDELHQLLVAGRNCSLFDVYLDTLGVSTGVCGIMAIFKIIGLGSKRKKVVEKV